MTKYLIYQASGGISHMLSGLSAAISLAKKTKRHLAIDTISHAGFGKDFDSYFTISDPDLSYVGDSSAIPAAYKFRGLTAVELADWNNHPTALEIHQGLFHEWSLTPGLDPTHNWRIDYDNLCDTLLNDEDPLAVYVGAGMCYRGFIEEGLTPCGDWNKYIKVVPHVTKCIIDKCDIVGPYIGVHFRNTDIANDVSVCISKLEKAVKLYESPTIYLATDDSTALDKFVKAFPESTIVQYTKPLGGEVGSVQGMHYLMEDKDVMITNTLLDIYMLVNASVFIYSENSSMSLWINQMREFDTSIFKSLSAT